MRSHYKIHEQTGVYFMTATIIEWIPIFTTKPYFDIIVSSLKYCQEKLGLQIYAYVILDNHFHLVCQAHELSKTMQSCKRHTAKTILEQLETDQKRYLLDLLKFYKKSHKTESEHQIWQEGLHPQQISSDKMLRQKIEYIHYNPVKRGYVEKPEHWLYSSAKTLMTGEKGPLELQPWLNGKSAALYRIASQVQLGTQREA